MHYALTCCWIILTYFLFHSFALTWDAIIVHICVSLQAGLYGTLIRRHPPKTPDMINPPLNLWLTVILDNHVVLFYATLTLIPFISLPSDIASNYDFIVYSLSIVSLSIKLSKGRHRMKTRGRSPKWLFICLLSGLTLLWWLCVCVCLVEQERVLYVVYWNVFGCSPPCIFTDLCERR